jgi:hypothetical protein
MSVHSEKLTPDQKRRGSELLQIVRDATRRLQDVSEAESEGYGLLFGCGSGEGRHTTPGRSIGLSGFVEFITPPFRFRSISELRMVSVGALTQAMISIAKTNSVRIN